MLWLQGSQAYAKALAKAGVLTAQEAEQIVEGLGKVRSCLAVWISCLIIRDVCIGESDCFGQMEVMSGWCSHIRGQQHEQDAQHSGETQFVAAWAEGTTYVEDKPASVGIPLLWLCGF